MLANFSLMYSTWNFNQSNYVCIFQHWDYSDEFPNLLTFKFFIGKIKRFLLNILSYETDPLMVLTISLFLFKELLQMSFFYNLLGNALPLRPSRIYIYLVNFYNPDWEACCLRTCLWWRERREEGAANAEGWIWTCHGIGWVHDCEGHQPYTCANWSWEVSLKDVKQINATETSASIKLVQSIVTWSTPQGNKPTLAQSRVFPFGNLVFLVIQ